MASEDLILRFDIVDGQTPDAEVIARALLAWIDMLKVAGSVLEPGSRLEVGLVGVESGSDVFKLSLRKAEGFATQLKAGMDEYPLVSKATMALAGLVGATVLTVAVTTAITPDPRIPKEQMAVFEEQNRLLAESNELQRQQQRFYGILHEEPAIKGVDVIRGYDRQPLYTVPYHEFAERSGLWSGVEEEPAAKVETITATWDVVLIKPVLIHEPRRWQFSRDGIEFSARMEDDLFLEALGNKSLGISMAEGVRMRIEVKYREEFDGTTWRPVKGSHRVSRVLDPLPPPPLAPLFSGAGSP